MFFCQVNPTPQQAPKTNGPTSTTNADIAELPIHLTPCLEEWLTNQDHYVTLSDMHAHGACHVLQLIDMTLKDGVPTGDVMLHDGVHYVTAKVSLFIVFCVILCRLVNEYSNQYKAYKVVICKGGEEVCDTSSTTSYPDVQHATCLCYKWIS